VSFVQIVPLMYTDPSGHVISECGLDNQDCGASQSQISYETQRYYYENCASGYGGGCPNYGEIIAFTAVGLVMAGVGGAAVDAVLGPTASVVERVAVGACADADCTNEVIQGAKVVKTAVERGQEAIQKVVDIFGDDVVGRNVDYKVYGPNGFSSDIDVVVAGNIPKIIEVGGYAKSFSISGFGSQITNLYKLAQLEGAEAYFYYVVGTPQQVIDLAIKKLGEGHVLPIP